jgi:hypothetical protein
MSCDLPLRNVISRSSPLISPSENAIAQSSPLISHSENVIAPSSHLISFSENVLNAPVYFRYLSISFVIIPSPTSPDMFPRPVSFQFCFAHTLVRAITHRPLVIPLAFRHDNVSLEGHWSGIPLFSPLDDKYLSSVIIDKTTWSLLT